MDLLISNLAITAVCLLGLGSYFNYREKKLQEIAQGKLQEIQERYVAQNAHRKAKEKQEIEKLKGIVQDLEAKHRQILKEKNSEQAKRLDSSVEAKDIIKKAKERAKELEDEAHDEAKKYIDEQKKEVQTKMVDLVMSVTKKVLAKSLSYEDHKELIEKAFLDAEGEVANDERD